MRRLFFIFVAAIGLFICSPAHSSECGINQFQKAGNCYNSLSEIPGRTRVESPDVQMPVYFVGDWCFEAQEGRTVSFLLPSWTEKGACRKILSVTDTGFFGAGHHCDPIETRLSTDVAPSGEIYFATILARCQPDGMPRAGKIRTIEFRRYKGNLQVTPQ